MENYYAELTTEEINPVTASIDDCSTLQMLQMINEQDCLVPIAVGKVLPEISKAVDLLHYALLNGGRMIYLGAGTSGRLGVLDAAECPTIFGISPTMVQAYIAGGDTALRTDTEGCEDSPLLGEKQILECDITSKDVVIGISASGSTAYVIAALKMAKEIGAKIIGVVNNSNSKFHPICDVCIAPIVGAEVITGSTRMKAGTAQKLVLNMLTTGTMIKLGKVYNNLMVDLLASNKKLYDRGIRLVVYSTGMDYETARHYFEQADHDVKLAIFMYHSGLDRQTSKERLEQYGGILKKAIRALS